MLYDLCRFYRSRLASDPPPIFCNRTAPQITRTMSQKSENVEITSMQDLMKEHEQAKLHQHGGNDFMAHV